MTITTSMAVTLPELVAVFNPDEPTIQQIILDVADCVTFVVPCSGLRIPPTAAPRDYFSFPHDLAPRSRGPPAHPGNGLTHGTPSMQ